MKTLLNALISSSLLLLGSACQPEAADTQNHAHTDHSNQPAAGGTQTLIQQAGPLQVTFDISTLQAHREMMQQMQMPASTASEASHYVLVTLSDPEARKPVQAEDLRLKFVGPDGQAIGAAEGMAPESFSRQGMFHYGHALNALASGDYEILVMFRWQGNVYSSGVKWNPAAAA
ncbi:MAG: hypothetical protein IGS03_12150 [Candidatus Sericytochromatia bacterium]|nr:hypothetical protein [Candidatus Sericytochromatia bacterium]